MKALENRTESFSVPSEIIPDENNEVCKHGNLFSDGYLKRESRHVTVYHEQGQTTIKCDVYCRQIRSCKCAQRADTHSLLLYHMGKGRCIDYVCLQKLCLLMNKSGTTIQGYYQHILDSCKALNRPFSCDYGMFIGCYNGFIANIAWSPKIFSCPNCGTKPKYYVSIFFYFLTL